MRKLTKTAAVVASMAVMAMGTTMMASAATEGWVQSGSNWYYYIKGNKAADQWVKAGDDWYFVDEEGRMAKNTFVRIDKYDGSSEVLTDEDIHSSLGQDDIDDDSEFYYMGADGKMITGWKDFKASSIYASPNSSKASTVWYYFGASGRMYVNEWVESSGEWYALSANGQMYAEAVVNNDLVNWDDDDNYYMSKSGAWVKGWYKTSDSTAGYAPEEAVTDGKDGDETKDVFFNGTGKKDKWVYGNPDTGVLAEKEWVEIGGKYYFFGEVASTNNNKDANLRLRNIVDADGDNLELDTFEVLPTTGSSVTVEIKESLDEDNVDAINSAAMLSNRFVQWKNHDNKIEYFYLTESGAALTTWKEFEDDYYICANSKGELYYDEVASINGRYYYFDQYGVCDYKNLNNKVDYVAVVKYDETKDSDDAKHLRLARTKGKDVEESDNTTGNVVVMYETTSSNNPYSEGDQYMTEDDIIINQDAGGSYYVSISNMKEFLADDQTDLSKVSYRINNRKVTVKSMTDNEVILAYTAKKQGAFDEDITVYKLRTSASISGKVSEVN